MNKKTIAVLFDEDEQSILAELQTRLGLRKVSDVIRLGLKNLHGQKIEAPKAKPVATDNVVDCNNIEAIMVLNGGLTLRDKKGTVHIHNAPIGLLSEAVKIEVNN